MLAMAYTTYYRKGMYKPAQPRPYLRLTASRPTSAAPKPNTRFLRNIIRNTDNHNTALKEKELSDAGKRLRAMARERVTAAYAGSDLEVRSPDHKSKQDCARKRKRVSRGREEPESHHIRSRTHARNRSISFERDVHGNQRHKERNHSRILKPKHCDHRPYSDKLRHKSGSRASENLEDQDERTRSNKSSRYAVKLDPKRLDNEQTSHQSRRKEPNALGQIPSSWKQNKSRSSSRSSTRSSDHESRSHKSRLQYEEEKPRRWKRRSSNSIISGSDHNSDTGPRRHHSGRKATKYDLNPTRLPSRRPQSDGSKKLATAANRQDQQDDDDDPLSAILGAKIPSEKTPPQLRGRGTASFASGIEQRFSLTYDPTSDVAPDPNIVGDEDWDQALEALRDRQKFRQVGTDRLLAAGFTKEEVERMEGGRERNGNDVRWTKKGEAREWDRGKKIDENGYVAVDGDKFGRLT